MEISSNSFTNGNSIPDKFTCNGEKVNPDLHIEEVPAHAESLALIVEDPDAPNGTFTHWVVWGIPSNTELIDENSIPEQASEGKNDFGKRGYGAPCPPTGHGEHRYLFRLFALDTDFSLPNVDTKAVPSPSTTRQELLQLMQGHILEEAKLIGTYARK